MRRCMNMKDCEEMFPSWLARNVFARSNLTLPVLAPNDDQQASAWLDLLRFNESMSSIHARQPAPGRVHQDFAEGACSVQEMGPGGFAVSWQGGCIRLGTSLTFSAHCDGLTGGGLRGEVREASPDCNAGQSGHGQPGLGL